MQSMTGFAARTGAFGRHSWSWDIRSVNGRGLDLRLRLPEGQGALEAALRPMITERLSRGNVTVGLRLAVDNAEESLRLDEAQLARVLAALAAIADRADAAGVQIAPPSASEVFATRGVIQQDSAQADEAETKALTEALAADFAPLLDAFCEMRAAEGAALATVITGQVDRIAAMVEAARALLPARAEKMRGAMTAAIGRVLEETQEVSEERLAQEMALLSVKSDISEELDRLAAHEAAARELLAASGPVGRKFDFLTQEFNREANTLCSKAGHSEMTRVGLDLKVVIDQMREQVQNVE